MEITYTRVGDYYLPNLAAPESPKVGRWGMLRFNYLRKHREALYTIMLMENTLNPHLEEIDRQAQEMEQQLISQLAQQEGITEQLKAENQMDWVARMNNIRNRADEIVLPGMLLHIRGWKKNHCLHVPGDGLSGPCGYSNWHKSEIDL